LWSAEMSSKLEYLKRYMSGEAEEKVTGKKKKKSKKKSKVKELGGFRIIDNDIGFSGGGGSDTKGGVKPRGREAASEEDDDEEDAYALGEEKPQVAAVVDERPAELTGKWKRMKRDTDESTAKGRGNSSPNRKGRHDSPEAASPPRRRRHDSDESPPTRTRHDSDKSPPRRSRHDSSDESPHRKKVTRHDSDDSPPRKARRDESPPRNARHDSDELPPRKKVTRHDSDESPPRKKVTRHDSNESPPRKARRDSDESPPRKKVTRPKSDSVKVKEEPIEVKQEPLDSDASPPRQQGRGGRGASRCGDGAKVKEEPVDSDASPPRNKRKKSKSDSDESPPRQGKLATKTLDGKKAGLQSAKGLRSEMEDLRQREKERIGALSTDVSGRNAETRVRGRYKEKLEEESRRKEKAAIPDEVKAKYAAWSKGEAQIKADNQRIQEELHEMSKPLARDADDADRDAHLKAIDRQEDPMLAFIKKKNAKKTDLNIERYPEYKGPQPAPNRFGIRPGYRWDGVDRSTGFEKKLFDSQTQRKARAQEAHMWSTEDM